MTAADVRFPFEEGLKMNRHAVGGHGDQGSKRARVLGGPRGGMELVDDAARGRHWVQSPSEGSPAQLLVEQRPTDETK